jgi:hypothetical protein
MLTCFRCSRFVGLGWLRFQGMVQKRSRVPSGSLSLLCQPSTHWFSRKMARGSRRRVSLVLRARRWARRSSLRASRFLRKPGNKRKGGGGAGEGEKELRMRDGERRERDSEREREKRGIQTGVEPPQRAINESQDQVALPAFVNCNQLPRTLSHLRHAYSTMLRPSPQNRLPLDTQLLPPCILSDFERQQCLDQPSLLFWHYFLARLSQRPVPPNGSNGGFLLELRQTRGNSFPHGF